MINGTLSKNENRGDTFISVGEVERVNVEFNISENCGDHFTASGEVVWFGIFGVGECVERSDSFVSPLGHVCSPVIRGSAALRERRYDLLTAIDDTAALGRNSYQASSYMSETVRDEIRALLGLEKLFDF